MRTIVLTADHGGNELFRLVAEQRTFKSGSRGFWAGGKVNIDGKMYQTSCSFTEIGSKPGSTLNEEKAA